VNAAENLAKRIIANYDNPLQSSTIDVSAHVESLLQSLGATTSDSGGKVTYYGADPITPDRLPYGSISAISLAAKAILIAKIWKERTGEGQDIHVDVRKALRRLTPFFDGKWELLNGFPGRTDPYSPFTEGPDIVPTKDGKWIMLGEIYPALRQRALELLKPRGSSYDAIRAAVKEWNGEELEAAGEKAGIPLPLARNIKDVLKMDAFTKNLGLMPLVSVEKVGDSRRHRWTGYACCRQATSSQARRSVAQWPCMVPTRSTYGGHPMSSTRCGTTHPMSACAPPCSSWPTTKGGRNSVSSFPRPTYWSLIAVPDGGTDSTSHRRK